MKRWNSLLLLFLPVVFIQASAYTKIVQEPVSKTDLMKKWANTFTVIEEVGADGNASSGITIFPNGYFKLNDNMSYERLSDGVLLNGTWDMRNNRLLVDLGSEHERIFNIIMLNTDSLVIQRSEGSTRYTQHYVVHNDHPRMTKVISAGSNKLLAVK